MKKFLSIGGISIALLFAIACDGNESGTHTHDDGSTHADHDTTAPAQQEFNAGDSTKTADSTKHDHDESKPHSHGGQSHKH